MIFRFYRSKCHKNLKMKRNPRKVQWTKAYRRLHGKDMTQDATFEFENKRNRPRRYDRNVTENTLKAIKKIDKVRADRADRHHKDRMKENKAQMRKRIGPNCWRAFTLSKLLVLCKKTPHSRYPR
ncbi:probable ribosome biogenesis protein rlp24 [Phtheirospermum japonicum]|uniref:Probable ribosome biogenesis protein rlp24 n=1 Tax=Phtheirospermum japonicum TaxID=374723 RepID=A0A830DQF2_9LAMI|nr:probable ribosome biogenesis protein rlp24 [Phtheirospermum japonicum]